VSQLEFQLFDSTDPKPAPAEEAAPENSSSPEDELPFSTGYTNRAAAPAQESDPGELSPEELARAELKLQRIARQLAAELGQTQLGMTVNVRWNGRMRTSAGRAHYRKSLIELNPRLLQLTEERDEEIDRTLKHELAHLIAFARASSRSIQPHGPEWKAACAELGIDGEDRCHSLPFQPRKMERKYLYRCPVCETEVPRVRKFKRPVACYDCCKKHSRGRFDKRFQLEKVK